jgi:hypothetical protein
MVTVKYSVMYKHNGMSKVKFRDKDNRTDHDQQPCYHQAPTVNHRLLLQLL